jgi:hypothetical protein
MLRDCALARETSVSAGDVLDRLLDLLLIAVLRAWFTRPDVGAPGWHRAYSDSVVGPALPTIHDNPAYA